MENLLPPIPEHLATLGMFDGPLGMATLGFIIGPDIVPRFPAEGMLEAEKLFGFVDEEALYALVEGVGVSMAAVEEQDLAGIFAQQTLTGAVDASQGGLEAMVDGNRASAEVVEDDEMFGALVTEADFVAELAECDLEGIIDDDELTASIEEAPGEGRCRE